MRVIKKGHPGEIWTGFRSSRWQIFFKMVFLKISQISQENTCFWRHFLIKLQFWRLQWLLLTLNSYFERYQELKLVRLVMINTRFSCKNIFNVAKVNTSVTEIIPGSSPFYCCRILSFFNFAMTKWFCCNMFL